MTSVKEIMTPEFHCIEPDQNLMEAAAEMKSRDVGALPVCRGNKVEGIITDRDIAIRAVAEGLDPIDTTVSEIMTSEIFLVREDQDLEEAVRLMEEKQVRRLVVTDAQDRPVGMLALADIALRADDEHRTAKVLYKISEAA